MPKRTAPIPVLEPISDEELVRRVLAGDRGVDPRWYALLAEVSQRAFYRYARYRWFDVYERENWTQEFQIRLSEEDWRRVRLWRGEGSLRAYLMTVARNVAASEYRKEYKHQRGRESFDDDSDSADDEGASEGQGAQGIAQEPGNKNATQGQGNSAEDIVAVRRQLERKRDLTKQLLQALRPEDQEVVELHFRNRVPGAEAAEKLGIPASTYRKRVERAKRRAAALLLRDPFSELGDDLERIFS